MGASEMRDYPGLAGIRLLRSRTKTPPRPDEMASWRDVAQILPKIKRQRADCAIHIN